MSGGSVRADHDGLQNLVTTLRNSADDLATAASPAPAAPDAGISSANVGDALSAIVKSTALLIAQQQSAANKINVNNGAYVAADNEVETGLTQLQGQLLEPG
ncbi:MAG TPA: hypothetical protein VHX38_40325 [Pseudonocardiaceae bacterium]|jgi:hypothetical protein|nr:hypothetical protein [Pseudonocardiaceae bacterium]